MIKQIDIKQLEIKFKSLLTNPLSKINTDLELVSSILKPFPIHYSINI